MVDTAHPDQGCYGWGAGSGRGRAAVDGSREHARKPVERATERQGVKTTPIRADGARRRQRQAAASRELSVERLNANVIGRQTAIGAAAAAAAAQSNDRSRVELRWSLLN